MSRRRLPRILPPAPTSGPRPMPSDGHTLRDLDAFTIDLAPCSFSLRLLRGVWYAVVQLTDDHRCWVAEGATPEGAFDLLRGKIRAARRMGLLR